MKILYAIQGTGNGHISRATEIIPHLKKRCSTDILISGYQSDLPLPFDVKYSLNGLSFIFGKKGNIDLKKTYSKINIKLLLKEIQQLPVKDYDFIINDFEPVSAWACLNNKIPCVALSHQAALLQKNVPHPKSKNVMAGFILNNYAPSTWQIGFHFGRYAKNIYTPVIRREIRNAVPGDEGHYTVYLPSYDAATIVNVLEKIPDVRWQVFSKHDNIPATIGNIQILPVNENDFIKSLTTSHGVLSGAGFETPSEALFLGKKLMVIPMQHQFEQQYNAAALKAMGVASLGKLRPSNVSKIRDWVLSDFRIEMKYPDITQKVIDNLFESFIDGSISNVKWNRFPSKLKLPLW